MESLTAAVASAAGAVALAPAMDQMGYKYVAYPREYYEDGIPTFEENFFDDDFDVLSKVIKPKMKTECEERIRGGCLVRDEGFATAISELRRTRVQTQ